VCATARVGSVEASRYLATPQATGPATLVEHAPMIDHLIAQRGQAGMAVDQLRLVRTLVQERIESGHGAEGFTGVIEQLGRPVSGDI
jgi:hypothetical protein